MRSAGVLLPVFSLPDKYGIGTFSAQAKSFIDFLSKCGQKYWQILPLGPVGEGFSPYQSFSSNAFEPLFIDLCGLIDRGLITAEECRECEGFDTDYVDYERLIPVKKKLLRLAFSRFEANDDYRAFCDKEKPWLDDYAIFMVVHDINDGKPLEAWPEDVRERHPDAVKALIAGAEAETEFHKFLQYIAKTQWLEVKRYANEKGIGIIGDLPIYVSPDGVDIWTLKELFMLSKHGHIEYIAGCPGDGFEPKGQLWNNPLYNWDFHRESGFEWWCDRMIKMLEMYDLVRIDHFRGFDEFFSIPKGDPDASRGKWLPGPGLALFTAMEKKLGTLPVIAEDLGFLTDTVRKLRDDTGYPGMKVLQFAFDGDKENEYLPQYYPANCVAYTGTHDNMTLLTWVRNLDGESKEAVKEFLGVDSFDETAPEQTAQKLIKAACDSNADLCVIPIQDYLMLDDAARINTPSTLGGNNWKWRIKGADLNDALASYIRELTQSSQRC